MKEEAAIKRRVEQVASKLNERARRLVAASEALALGWGGVSAVSRATGLSRKAISHGIKELQEGEGEAEGRMRRTGGGRKKPGRQWAPQGQPEQVRVYDFPLSGLGRATPYGVYDLGRKTGWVKVGMDHASAAFAVESIRRWWETVGQHQYPEAKRLLINADGGGRNGSRVRLWKWEVQPLAHETGLAITVCHLPPGTGKWNKPAIDRSHHHPGWLDGAVPTRQPSLSRWPEGV